MLNSLIGTELTLSVFLICTAVSLVLGIGLALVSQFRARSTQSFAVTLAVLPMVVQVVIMLVNGNIGAGVAVAGAFSLVRFRSAPGTAREIARYEAVEILTRLGIEDVNQKMGTLSGGQRKRVALASTLVHPADLLLLDEPAAGMNPNETQELMDTIEFVRENFDMTVLLIEHDMRLVAGICEELTVLNFGTVLAQGKTKDVLNNPEVIKAYLGE